MELIISIVSLLTSLTNILFTVLAFHKSEKNDQKKEGKSEGTMLSDIGYIKACVDRVEKNIGIVDERYRNVAERLAKLEESIKNAEKRIGEIYEKGRLY